MDAWYAHAVPAATSELREPPLTARSVILSTLLGTDPPRLPVRRLVKVGGLFGCNEGTVRTALSRMVGRGEVVAVGDGAYELGAGQLVRHRRQRQSRAAATVDWDGRWRLGVVAGGARSQPERRALRADLERLRFAPLRDGVWGRPDNLPHDRLPEVRERIAGRCSWFVGAPDDDETELVARLWDLDGWAARADGLRREMAGLLGRLDDGDTDALAPGFVTSAAVLRHLQADPLLPRELLDRRWPGARLRADYDRYDAAYRALLADWWRT